MDARISRYGLVLTGLTAVPIIAFCMHWQLHLPVWLSACVLLPSLGLAALLIGGSFMALTGIMFQGIPMRAFPESALYDALDLSRLLLRIAFVLPPVFLFVATRGAFFGAVVAILITAAGLALQAAHALDLSIRTSIHRRDWIEIAISFAIGCGFLFVSWLLSRLQELADAITARFSQAVVMRLSRLQGRLKRAVEEKAAAFRGGDTVSTSSAAIASDTSRFRGGRTQAWETVGREISRAVGPAADDFDFFLRKATPEALLEALRDQRADLVVAAALQLYELDPRRRDVEQILRTYGTAELMMTFLLRRSWGGALALLKDESHTARARYVETIAGSDLWRLAAPDVQAEFRRTLAEMITSDPSALVRATAVKALPGLGLPPGEEARLLAAAMMDEDHRVRTAAVEL